MSKHRDTRDQNVVLKQRKQRLARLIGYDAPDIIIDLEMSLVAKSQRAVYGRGWNKASLRSRIAGWWKYRVRKYDPLKGLSQDELDTLDAQVKQAMGESE